MKAIKNSMHADKPMPKKGEAKIGSSIKNKKHRHKISKPFEGKWRKKEETEIK